MNEQMLELASRCERASGPDRSLDRAIGFQIGLGVEKERKLYAEMGDAMWIPTPELRGLTPYDRARGSTVRSEWVKGSRGRRGHYQDVRWGACDGPMPLTNSPAYTASIDAAMMLVPEGWGWTLGDKSPTPSIAWCEIEGLAWKEGYGWAVDRRLMVEAAAPALALCAAALRARAASPTLSADIAGVQEDERG